ncbi:hypothetical protein [Flavobacterium sp.]|uniref:hypothetical protein n=1 Tax=Flavobacterium sp. TaxID=239 RepID=UPI0035B48BFD
MSKTMLLYTKRILLRVSFDVQLFYKEFEKASKMLLPHELKELTNWLLNYTVDKPKLRQCPLNI